MSLSHKPSSKPIPPLLSSLILLHPISQTQLTPISTPTSIHTPILIPPLYSFRLLLHSHSHPYAHSYPPPPPPSHSPSTFPLLPPPSHTHTSTLPTPPHPPPSPPFLIQHNTKPLPNPPTQHSQPSPTPPKPPRHSHRLRTAYPSPRSAGPSNLPPSPGSTVGRGANKR